MNKLTFLVLTGAAVTLLSACIPSVNPFYAAEDIRFDARLLGEWHDKAPGDGPETWTFARGDEKSYKLTVTEKGGKQGTFHARLFQLKDQQFIDLVPADCKFDPTQAELISMAVFPGHLLVRVVQTEPNLKLAFCDFDWLGKHLEKNPKALAHHEEDKRVLLTATTRDLQRFVLQHLREGELFQDSIELSRLTR